MRHPLLSAIMIPAALTALVISASSQELPRPEYPRPEMVRAEWRNLNGPWDFAIDSSNTGEERGMAKGEGFARTILVPFAPESPLSGIGHSDFMDAVWYKRSLEIPSAWTGRRVLLHFEAVDYKATVWVNGAKAGEHEGGYTPFAVDLTDHLKPSGNLLVVRAVDRTRSGLQPTGKQSTRFASYSCFYRRTTGIWQTVWMEAVPDIHVRAYRIHPDADSGEAVVRVFLNKAPEGGRVGLKAAFAGKPEFAAVKPAAAETVFTVKLKSPKLWGVREPHLYDLEIVYEKDEAVVDRIEGYFGLRKIEVRGNRVFLNNKPLFLRTVLDQGFYPDGIYTAPSDEALKGDIELSMSLGFDGARLHQRVFERRFLHWADRMGYYVWGEFADWGLDLAKPEAFLVFVREWTEMLERDFNHPSIIGWCPFNERWGGHTPGLIPAVYALTKILDPSRLAIDASGGWHYVSSEVYDAHDYDQSPERFKERYDGLLASPPKVHVNGGPERNAPYAGQPYFLSEYGGIWWNPGQKDDKAWGYGDRPKSEAEFLDRFTRLTTTLLDNPAVAGFCYTQLTDVEQEVNGLLTFDRKPKFDPAVIRAVNQKRAAVEK